MTTPTAGNMPPNVHRLSNWLKAPAGILFLAAAVAYGFFAVFTRKLSADEGYLMITVQGFLDGNALYDTLFTQYGPFYYLYEWLWHSVLRVPLTHDATRWLCLFHWMAASIIFAVAVGRMTKSLVVGVLVFTQAVIHLGGLANEPGHPQELVVILLAIGAACATRQGGPIGAVEMLAAIAAALAFTKINVGAFFAFALFLTLRAQANDRFAAWSNWLLLAFCIAAPFVLMRHHLSIQWCRNHSMLIATTLAATFITAWRFSNKTEMQPRRYFRMAAFFIVPALACVAVAVFTGTSAHGVIEGLIVTPIRMPASVYMTMPLRNIVPLIGLVSAGTALVVAWRGTDGRLGTVVAILKTAYSLVGLLVLVGEPLVQFAYLLPWAWLAVVPTGNQQTRTAARMFPRVFLCLAAVWQALQTYPVAGTQVTNGTCLLMLTYALCLVDVLSSVSFFQRIQEKFTQLKPSTINLGQVLGTALLLYVFVNVWCELPVIRRAYTALPALDLPGSRMIRVPPAAKDFYHQLVAYLDTDSDTFISIPCLNSLYFWTQKRPPTQLNGSGWYQFNHEQQEKILAAIRKHPRAKIVVPDDLMSNLPIYWYTPEQISPLIKCLSNECEEVNRIGPLVVFALKTDLHASR